MDPIHPNGEWIILDKPHESGLAALGGDFSVDSLYWAYSKGFFPWYRSGGFIHWFSPDPRFIITAGSFKIPRSLRSLLRKDPFNYQTNSHFEEVMQECRKAKRPDQESTWILEDMIPGYLGLANMGYAESAETYQNGELVGGLYGVRINKAFSGESMFAKVNDSSKIAFAKFALEFFNAGGLIIDCQMKSDLFERFGGHMVPREKFETLWSGALDEQ